MTNTYKNLTAPELVNQWKRLVNGEVMTGRDSHMFRVFMDERGVTPAQILLGFYSVKGQSLTVPMFLRYTKNWLWEDPFEAEILLAKEISGDEPKYFRTYWDLLDSGIESADLERQFREAKWELQQWADRILSQSATSRRVEGGRTGTRN